MSEHETSGKAKSPASGPSIPHGHTKLAVSGEAQVTGQKNATHTHSSHEVYTLKKTSTSGILWRLLGSWNETEEVSGRRNTAEKVESTRRWRVMGTVIITALIVAGGVVLYRVATGGTGTDLPRLPTVEADNGRHTGDASVVPRPVAAHEITSPTEGENVKFVTGSGQGGRIEVSGQSPALKDDQVLLLTVTPGNGPEHAQVPWTPIRPSADGRWSTQVQVGNSEWQPERGQSFSLKLYVVPVADFDELHKRAGANGPAWPLQDRPVPIAVLQRGFILTN